MSVYLRFLRGALVAAVSLSSAVLPAPALAQQFWAPSLSWNTYLGGGTLPDGGVDTGTTDRIDGVAVASDGDVIVTGHTDSRTFPATPSDAGLPTGASGSDVFVARYSADGQTLRWARVFGGPGTDVGTQVAVTSTGAVYVTGTTQSSTINIAPARTAPLIASYAGRKDAFLARLNYATGALEWFMYVGSILDDEAHGVVLGPQGSNVVYMVGRTGRDDGIGSLSDDTPIAFPPDSGLSNERLRAFEAFVTQVDVAAAAVPVVRWTRILKSEENDSAYSVAVQGDSLFVGGIMGSHFAAGSIPVRNTFGGGADDGFVARLESDAGVSWFSYVGGGGTDDVRGVLARPDGGIAVVGNTNSANFPVGGASNDVYVLRLSEEAIREGFGMRVGADGSERTEGHAAIDPYGNVYVGGRTDSSVGLTKNAFDTTLGVNRDGFIAMVGSPAANMDDLIWASYVGGISTSDDWVQGIAAGPRGQVTFGGYSSAANWLPHDAGVDRSFNGGTDGFLFRLEVDSTPPLKGDVFVQQPGGRLELSWAGFEDDETPIAYYEWAIGVASEDTSVASFQGVGTATSVSPQFRLQAGTYYVTVRATNAVGLQTAVSKAFDVLPPAEDAGTDGGEPDADAGTDGGRPDGGGTDGGVDAGTDGGTRDGGPEDEGETRSPLGWSCASGGGSGSLGLVGLMVLAALLARRRERPVRVQARR